jgi:CRISPR-associated protein Cmr3
MTKKYLVKLTPHDKFFFGGENTFGEGDKRNYFVKSNYFPQQTTLLGLVRYQLMVQNSKGVFENNKIINTKEAEKIISNKSFEITDKSYSFGKILEISPDFISDANGKYLFPANKEYQWVDKEDGIEINNYQLRQYSIREGSSCLFKTKEYIPYLEKYNPKIELPDLLINSDAVLYNYEKIFIEQKQIGIRKNYEGKTDDDAFYVQTFYKLEKGYSFAFILTLEDDINFSTNELVTIGGEQSKFRMDVEDFSKNYEDLLPKYEKSKNSDKIVLVSDAYVSNDIFDDCDFAVTDTIDFRSMKSSVDTNNYAKLDLTDGVSKSGKYNFFKKGSVFYGKVDNIQQKLNDKNHLKIIGYNHYNIVNKEEAQK